MTEIKTVDVHELKNKYDSDPNVIIIDVREQEEWDEIHIPRAIHVPKSQIHKVQELAPDLNTYLYLHCKGGTRSLNACSTLMDLGYKNVFSVTGGITAWDKAQYPVETN